MTSKGRIKPMTSFRNLSFLNWDTSISRESVKKVDELAFKWICPAHGDPAERNGKWDI
jgi:glyoxylase-like metal-dependent hydrolase (beta-lactamase superfamily II)